jgi:hypothetical protein
LAGRLVEKMTNVLRAASTRAAEVERRPLASRRRLDERRGATRRSGFSPTRRAEARPTFVHRVRARGPVGQPGLIRRMSRIGP